MSYVVHLWEYPAPSTLQSAESVHNMLVGKPSRPNPKWARLAERTQGDAVLECVFTRTRASDPDWIEFSGQAVYDALRKLPLG